MDTDQAKNNVAQPADEELKAHGDKLAKQVRDAAGQPAQKKNLPEDTQPRDG